MKCAWCGTEFKQLHGKQQYCQQKCAREMDKSRRKRKNIASVKIEIQPYNYKPRPVYETDEEQLKIREALAKKWENKPSEVKHYRPGDPDFDRIAQQILRVSSIRNVSALYGLASGAEGRERYGEL